jgi:hypothetical protein
MFSILMSTKFSYKPLEAKRIGKNYKQQGVRVQTKSKKYITIQEVKGLYKEFESQFAPGQLQNKQIGIKGWVKNGEARTIKSFFNSDIIYGDGESEFHDVFSNFLCLDFYIRDKVSKK